MFKNQKGITLIALVITIIVLLILAGITIALITNNDSAPNRAAQAKIEQDVGAAKDSITMNAANLMTKYYEDLYVTSTHSKTATDDVAKYATAGAFIGHADNASSLIGKVNSNITARKGTKSSPATGETNQTVELESKDLDTSSKSYKIVGTIMTDGTISWGVGAWDTPTPTSTTP